MRILHTADWHLGKRLRGFDRTDDQFAQVEHVCQLTEEHNVDILLVAGDVFDASPKRLPELTKRLAEHLQPRIEAGLHVILVPGNHDDREHFRMMHALLYLDRQSHARLHVVRTREVFEIDGVQFGIIPYPTREVLYAQYAEITGGVERNVSLSTAFASLVRAVGSKLAQGSQPAVFVTHVTVQGVTTPSQHELSYAEDLLLGRQDLPTAGNLAYIALGHIHQPQEIGHSVPCYYSGSLDRLDRGEREDEKSVLLVDVPDSGPATVEAIPLEVTPFYEIKLTASDLDTLPDKYPDLDQAFVQVHLKCEEGDDVAALMRQVGKLCPRMFDAPIITYPDSASANIVRIKRPEDYKATVMEYLEEVRGDDEDFSALKQLTLELIEEVQNAN